MRKLVVLLLASIVLAPAAASAERLAPGDGSLVVSAANGRLTLSGQGLIYGYFDSGTLTIVGNYKPDDVTSLSSVTGATQTIVGKNTVYTGSGVRFYFPGGQYTIIVDATNIDISAVGRGTISSVGRGSANDGTFTVDGNKARSIDTTGTFSFGKAVATVTVPQVPLLGGGVTTTTTPLSQGSGH
jgi:hypothetical protein